MGWTFRTGASKQTIISDILKPWDFTVKPEDASFFELKPGDRKQSVVLKHRLSGDSLWYLRENTITSLDGNIVRLKWIGVSLLEAGDDGWGHKDMSISMGPHANGCPVSWLKEIPVPDAIEDQYAYDWYMNALGTPVNRCENCKKIDCPGHDNELIVMAAWGDWATNVPVGMVGVAACFGGRRKDGHYASALLYRLVPGEVYDKRGDNAFVVDHHAAPEWDYDEANPYKPSERKAVA
ncbi:MAG: hypothetical protein WBQ34_12060 [Candidatus Acidiferrales bacterium]|jgi:hypothetical protein